MFCFKFFGLKATVASPTHLEDECEENDMQLILICNVTASCQ